MTSIEVNAWQGQLEELRPVMIISEKQNLRQKLSVETKRHFMTERSIANINTYKYNKKSPNT